MNKELAGRILQAAEEIGAIKKTGKNSHFNYRFHETHVIMERVAPVLRKHRILFHVDVVSYEKRDNTGIVNAAFSLIDADNPDVRFTSRMPGEGQDNQDKGISKALTQALKKFLLMEFMIPENEGLDDRPPQPQPAKPRDPGTSSARTSDFSTPSPRQALKLRELAGKLQAATGEPVDIKPPRTSEDAEKLIEQIQGDLERAEKKA